MKTFEFSLKDFTEICSLWSNRQYGNIDSNNGLAQNRQQAIIWSNVSMRYWCIYASLGLNVLMQKRRNSSVLEMEFRLFALSHRCIFVKQI